MENGTTTAVMQPGRLIVRSTRERRTPEHEARFQRILAVRAADPERFKRKKEEPPIRFDLSQVIKQHGPGVLVTNRPEPLCYAPFFLTDLYEASCATESEAKMYKKLVNDDPVNYVLSVVNRKTGLVDEEFTARMIKRYREDPGESSVTAVASSGTVDEVRDGIYVLKLTG